MHLDARCITPIVSLSGFSTAQGRISCEDWPGTLPERHTTKTAIELTSGTLRSPVFAQG
jgi:hypothetical protein